MVNTCIKYRNNDQHGIIRILFDVNIWCTYTLNITLNATNFVSFWFLMLKTK